MDGPPRVNANYKMEPKFGVSMKIKDQYGKSVCEKKGSIFNKE